MFEMFLRAFGSEPYRFVACRLLARYTEALK